MHETGKYSQLLHISHPDWKPVGCGIVSLAMIIDFFLKKEIDVDVLLEQGLAAGAYLQDIGWKHAELAQLAERYGLHGKNFDLAALPSEEAYARMLPYLHRGPVMASIHNGFEESGGGHLIVVTGEEGDEIHYNDPNSDDVRHIERIVPKDVFLKGWKRRFIIVSDSEIS